ncbi:MAG: RagB/SusD family nutrient uptake outer membrane protein [Candidatus Cryptobacteroides sp.]
MRLIKNIILCAIAAAAVSCSGFLDKYPQTGPSNEDFFSNEDELTLAINGAYSSLYWMSDQNVQYQLFLDGATDIVYIRGTYANMNTIQAGQSNGQTNVFAKIWTHFYTKISLTNNILDNIHRAEGKVSEEFYNRIEAEARFLRAYCYSYLVFLYGDVPYIDHMLDWKDCIRPKNKAVEIIGHIYDDLDFASEHLPAAWGADDSGRVTKGAALGLKARVALYAGDWKLSAEAAGEVIESKTYSIDPDYGSLFTHSGENSPEIMLAVQYLKNVQINANAKYIGTRLSNGYSVIVPTQTLVDMYQCRDGQRIDKSPQYNPLKPYENRDPRLDMSIIRPGGWHNGYKFEIHPDSTKTSAIIDGKEVRVGNTEVTNAYGTFTGYVGRKYFDEADLPDFISESELNFILMRYAEVLLTYAEAKIESGEIDDSVIEAINQVRRRPGVSMPAATLSMGSEALRELVRYERTVEFAMEGLRLFDIRRWRIAEYVLPGKLLGKRVKAHWYDPVIPSFNEWGKPVYTDESIFNSLGDLSFDPATGYLWPIPQSEIDQNPLLAEKL